MSEFDTHEYYQTVKQPAAVPTAPVLEYIRGFERVVLWGASYLGSSIGAYLQEHGIPIALYWDLRSEQIGSLHGVPVAQPFSGENDRTKTLVILCISNNLLKPVLTQTLAREGFTQLLGDALFMGCLCPNNIQDGLEPEVCMRSMNCRFIFCERLGNLVKHQSLARQAPKEGAPLFMNSITVIVNQVCSLGCKFCTSYLNAYPSHKRQNFPLERITSDIQRFFGAVDAVGTITVMGGEPFLHPDLSAIVQTVLDQPNGGLVSISTSGTALIKQHHLPALRDPRVNVSFSNYVNALNERQQELFDRNVAFLRREGIPHTVGIEMPSWITPSTLYDRGMCEAEIVALKQNCVTPPRCIQLKNGKIHPCDFGNAVYSLEVADYPNDYVDMVNTQDTAELRANIRSFMDVSSYKTCGHCCVTGTLTSKAGEQGFQDFRKIQ
jgi:hypothetical protein